MTFPGNFILFMDKKNIYREQAEKFGDFARKFPDRDLLSLFEKWAESKGFSDEHKHEIWQIVRRFAS